MRKIILLVTLIAVTLSFSQIALGQTDVDYARREENVEQYQRAVKQATKDYKKQIKQWRKRYKLKSVLPVPDPAQNFKIVAFEVYSKATDAYGLLSPEGDVLLPCEYVREVYRKKEGGLCKTEPAGNEHLLFFVTDKEGRHSLYSVNARKMLIDGCHRVIGLCWGESLRDYVFASPRDGVNGVYSVSRQRYVLETDKIIDRIWPAEKAGVKVVATDHLHKPFYCWFPAVEESFLCRGKDAAGTEMYYLMRGDGKVIHSFMDYGECGTLIVGVDKTNETFKRYKEQPRNKRYSLANVSEEYHLLDYIKFCGFADRDFDNFGSRPVSLPLSVMTRDGKILIKSDYDDIKLHGVQYDASRCGRSYIDYRSKKLASEGVYNLNNPSKSVPPYFYDASLSYVRRTRLEESKVFNSTKDYASDRYLDKGMEMYDLAENDKVI